MQKYENTGVAAYQLMVVEDSRTSKICRHLLTASGYGMILPIDHPFWKKYGFPGYHINCRTSIAPVYPSMIGKYGYNVDNPSMKSLQKFKPQEGFGGNPVDKESWWRMTKDMAFRAAKYGLWDDIEKYAKNNKLYNFAMDLVDGSDWQNLHGTIFNAEKAKVAGPKQKEVNLAKILTENGHSWYFTPENKSVQNLKNYDGILDGKIAEMKVLESKKIDKLKDRILECEEQKANTACIHVLNTDGYTKAEAVEYIKDILKNGLEHIKEVFLVYKDEINVLK